MNLRTWKPKKHNNNKDNILENHITHDNINMNNLINKNICKNRHRNIFWFNSFFCKLSNINIRKYFLGLIEKYFKKDNFLCKIINWNNVKISYSCTLK